MTTTPITMTASMAGTPDPGTLRAYASPQADDAEGHAGDLVAPAVVCAWSADAGSHSIFLSQPAAVAGLIKQPASEAIPVTR